MNKEEIFDVLYGKEKVEVYREFQEIENSIEKSDDMYKYFDDIKDMLYSDKSYIRVRAFRIISKLAKWDKKNKINEIINILLNQLEDDKPTSVRQYLSALEYMLIYKKELKEIVYEKLNKIDYSKYSDSMSPLIKKDIDNILNKK